MVEDRYEGYLYVVLAGEAYDSVVQRLQGSHILRLSVLVTSLALVLAGIAGVVLFSHLTRRLRSLAGVMDEFRKSDFSTPVDMEIPRGGGDEIDTLTDTFESMSDRIIQQVQNPQADRRAPAGARGQRLARSADSPGLAHRLYRNPPAQGGAPHR